jgi:hypothetical protein
MLKFTVCFTCCRTKHIKEKYVLFESGKNKLQKELSISNLIRTIRLNNLFFKLMVPETYHNDIELLLIKDLSKIKE